MLNGPKLSFNQSLFRNVPAFAIPADRPKHRKSPVIGAKIPEQSAQFPKVRSRDWVFGKRSGKDSLKR